MTSPLSKYVPPFPPIPRPVTNTLLSQEANEKFFQTLTSALPSALLGTLSAALTSLAYPSMKTTKSVLMGTVLRIGDVEGRPQEAAEILVKSSKCTALARPKGWKKFGRRVGGEEDEDEDMGGDDEERKTAYAQLTMRTEYFVDRAEHDEHEEAADKDKDKDAMDVDEDGEKKEKVKEENIERVEKEQLVRGFKYGTTYVPCPDGQFPKLNSVKGIDICGFFRAENVCPFPALLPTPY